MEEMQSHVYNQGIMYEEPIVIFKEKGRLLGRLAFPPIEILKVYNPVKEIYLQEGEDFFVVGKELVFKESEELQESSFQEEWLLGKNLPKDIENLGSQYKIDDVLLIGARELAAFQFRVTYKCKKPNFPQMVEFGENLNSLKAKIREGKEIKIILYGDSICNAANSSGEAGVPPFERAWYEIALERCCEAYGNPCMKIFNRSRSGYGTDWGAQAAEEKIEEADLLIVAFGMNDAADTNLSARNFEKNIRKILASRKNGDCDFILISSILPNPQNELFRYDLRKIYAEKLREICKEKNGAFINMTCISEFYIGKKRYCEISGNNFNHPNDFIYKFYADALAIACIGKE